MRNESMSQNEIKSFGIKLLIVFLIIIVVGFVLALGIKWFINHNGPRKASLNDIDGYWTDNITSQTFTFIPRAKINELEFLFTVYDKNGDVIQKINKSIGNVKEGIQYTVTISMTDLYFESLWEGCRIHVEIYNGTIPMFG